MTYFSIYLFLCYFSIYIAILQYWLLLEILWKMNYAAFWYKPFYDVSHEKP